MVLAAAVVYIVYVADSDIPSPAPKITEVKFPEKINLSELTWGEVGFEDSEGDVTQLIAEELDRASTLTTDLKELGATGVNSGYVPYGQTVDDAQFMFQRLTLVDAMGNRSAPYIFRYQAGDPTEYYDRYDAEEANRRPISQRHKVHFFVLSGTKSDLEQGASFNSDDDMLGAVSPKIAKLFEYTAVPEVNGLWDQCGIEFELGDVKVVRAEKVKLKSGRFLSHLFGNYKGEKVALVSSSAEKFKWIDDALPVLGVPKGDLAAFITGYTIWILGTDEERHGYAASNSVILSWRSIHFEDENAGYITLPRLTLSALAHEIGHNLGLYHPGEDEVVPKNKFNKFNLMDGGEEGLHFELIQEQCEVARANLDRR